MAEVAGPEQEIVQPVPTAAAESGFERVALAVKEDSGLDDSHIRSIALQSHRMMLSELGGPEKAMEALESLKGAGVISAEVATIYKDALTAAGADSGKFADIMVEKRHEVAALIERDMATSPTAAIAMLDNTDAGMTATQVEARSKIGYESLLKASNNDMAAVTTAIDHAVETGQLNAQNATVIRDAAQKAGTDSTRFAQLMAENKDSLAQLALLQATQGKPADPAAAGGDISKLFGDMKDNPMMQMINQLLMAFTGGKMGLDTIMASIQKKTDPAAPQGPAQNGGTQAGGATVEIPTVTPTVPVTPTANNGATGDQPVVQTPILTTAVADDSGITVDTKPVVDLNTGTLSVGGMSAGDRFAMNANPDQSRVTTLDPRVDPLVQTTPRLTLASLETTETQPRWQMPLMA